MIAKNSAIYNILPLQYFCFLGLLSVSDRGFDQNMTTIIHCSWSTESSTSQTFVAILDLALKYTGSVNLCIFLCTA